MKKLSGKAIDRVFAYLTAKKPLDEILARGVKHAELSNGDKLFVYRNDMETLLQSNKSTITHDIKQRDENYVIEVRINDLRFVHVSKEKWWQRTDVIKDSDYSPLSGNHGP